MIDLMRLRQWWERFWLAPVPALNVGVFRILFCTAFIYEDISEWRYFFYDRYVLLPQVWREETFLFAGLGIPWPGPDTVLLIQWVWHGALVLGALGLFTRLSLGIGFFAIMYLMNLQYAFGTAGFSRSIIPLVILVLVLCPGTGACSLDQLWRRSLRGFSHALVSGWGLRLIQGTLLFAFFFAGISKVVHGGWDWIATDNLQNHILLRHFLLAERQGDLPFFYNLGLTVAGLPLLCKFLAGSAVLLELLAPLALGRWWPRPVIITCLLALHAGAYLLLHVEFFAFLPVYLAFVPWDAVLRRVQLSWKSEAARHRSRRSLP